MNKISIQNNIDSLDNCKYVENEGRIYWRATLLFKYFEFEKWQNFHILIDTVSEQINKVDLHKKEVLIGNPINVTNEILLSRSFCERLLALLPNTNDKTIVGKEYFGSYYGNSDAIITRIINNY